MAAGRQGSRAAWKCAASGVFTATRSGEADFFFFFLDWKKEMSNNF